MINFFFIAAKAHENLEKNAYELGSFWDKEST